MSDKFNGPKSLPFVHYYPNDLNKIEEYNESFRCACGHLEDRIELIEYNAGPEYDEMILRCEKCDKDTSHFL